MTEQQREEDLLANLLDVSQSAGEPAPANHARATLYEQHAATPQQPILTRREEQRLLRAANQAGTPTLAPQETGPAEPESATSFVSAVASLVRRHPIPALLAGAGLAFLLTRRRR